MHDLKPQRRPYDKPLALAHLLLVLAGVALLAIITFGVWKLVVRSSTLADHVDAILTDAQKRIDGTSANTNAVLIQMGLAADEVRRTSITERQYLATISKETVTALATVNDSLTNLDGAVKEIRQSAAGINTQTLPAINLAVASVTSAVNRTSDVIGRAGATVDALTETAKEGGVVLGDAHVLLSDPALRLIGPNLAATTKHLDGSMANVEETTRYIADDFKPTKRSFWHNLTSQIIPTLLHFLIPAPVRVTNK